MDNLTQKTIDQYLAGLELEGEQRDRVLAAITHMVYERNQNVIKAEQAEDEIKRKQHIESVAEYDQLIEKKIKEVLDGQAEITYDF